MLFTIYILTSGAKIAKKAQSIANNTNFLVLIKE